MARGFPKRRDGLARMGLAAIAAMAFARAHPLQAQGTIVPMPLPPPSAATADPASCDQHGAVAEAALQIPSGLLRAIGRVESGRRNPATGGFTPWPWTINANGQGRFFNDSASAAEAVRALQAAGTASIDVGCFQVNLMHHPYAFRSVEEAFQPAANATYAAAYLTGLRQKLGGWEQAVAAYHSATPERGEPYRARVYAAWGQGGSSLAAATPGAAAVAASRSGPLVIRISGPELGGPDSEIKVWTPSRPGTAPAMVGMPAITTGIPPGIPPGSTVTIPASVTVVLPNNR